MLKILWGSYVNVFFIYFLCVINTLVGQNHRDFTTIQNYVLSEVATGNIETFTYTDTLNLLAEIDIYEVLMDMTSAILYYQLGNKKTSLLICVFTISLLVGIITFFYLRKRMLIINKVNGLKNSIRERNRKIIISSNATNSMKSIFDKTVSRILESLSKIEKTTFFIQADSTLARSIAWLETYSEYLSNVTNTHHQKTLLVYTYDLDINCIAERIKNEPIKYKTNNLTGHLAFPLTVSFVQILNGYLGSLRLLIFQIFKQYYQLILIKSNKL